MACFIHASSTDTPGIDDMDTGHPLPAIYNDDDDNPPASIHPPAPGIASLAMAPTPLHRLTTISQALKRDLKLSPKSEAKLDLYCNSSDIEERMTIHYAIDLKILELMIQNQKADNWVISTELNKSINLYTKALLLSPTIKSYKGNHTQFILKAMRDMKVPDLPLETQVIQVSEVLSAIGTALTSQRNTIKTKIAASMEEGSKIRNIADLTHDLLHSTRMQTTLQHYMRISFLRFHVELFPKDPQFWEKVDLTLTKYRKVAKSEADLTASFNLCFQKDKNKYGDPAESSHDTIEPINLDDWTKAVDKYAATVHAQTATTAQKRRRTTAGDN